MEKSNYGLNCQQKIIFDNYCIKIYKISGEVMKFSENTMENAQVGINFINCKRIQPPNVHRLHETIFQK